MISGSVKLEYVKCPRALITEEPLDSRRIAGILDVGKVYPARVTPYYFSLVKEMDDPVWRQCIPDRRELDDDHQSPDPLSEASLSPVPGFIRRYPDRGVLIVSNRCPVYCRFCMRKRHVGGESGTPSGDSVEAALRFIAATPSIRDVILSGGDPLMLDDSSLAGILERIRSISHVSVIRIGTRVPVTFPERITTELCDMLKRFHPVYVNTHFNHSAEITAESSKACALLADAGIPVGNQSVLLRGVNDSPEAMKELVTSLLGIRVRPYYLHHMDMVRGTSHFRTSVESGLEIIRGLRGHCSGLAVPQYVIDLPGGKGKVPILPDAAERRGDNLLLTTFRGERILYPATPPE